MWLHPRLMTVQAVVMLLLQEYIHCFFDRSEFLGKTVKPTEVQKIFRLQRFKDNILKGLNMSEPPIRPETSQRFTKDAQTQSRGYETDSTSETDDEVGHPAFLLLLSNVTETKRLDSISFHMNSQLRELLPDVRRVTLVISLIAYGPKPVRRRQKGRRKPCETVTVGENEHKTAGENEYNSWIGRDEDNKINVMDEGRPNMPKTDGRKASKMASNSVESDPSTHTLESEHSQNAFKTGYSQNSFETEQTQITSLSDIETQQFQNISETNNSQNVFKTGYHQNKAETEQTKITSQSSNHEHPLETKKFQNVLETNNFQNVFRTGPSHSNFEQGHTQNTFKSHHANNALDTESLERYIFRSGSPNNVPTDCSQNAFKMTDFRKGRSQGQRDFKRKGKNRPWRVKVTVRLVDEVTKKKRRLAVKRVSVKQKKVLNIPIPKKFLLTVAFSAKPVLTFQLICRRCNQWIQVEGVYKNIPGKVPESGRRKEINPNRPFLHIVSRDPRPIIPVAEMFAGDMS